MVHATAIINASKTLVADPSQWFAIVGSPLRRFSWLISPSLQERVCACQRSVRETRNWKLETRKSCDSGVDLNIIETADSSRLGMGRSKGRRAGVSNLQLR